MSDNEYESGDELNNVGRAHYVDDAGRKRKATFGVTIPLSQNAVRCPFLVFQTFNSIQFLGQDQGE